MLEGLFDNKHEMGNDTIAEVGHCVRKVHHGSKRFGQAIEFMPVYIYEGMPTFIKLLDLAFKLSKTLKSSEKSYR